MGNNKCNLALTLWVTGSMIAACKSAEKSAPKVNKRGLFNSFKSDVFFAQLLNISFDVYFNNDIILQDNEFNMKIKQKKNNSH